jgi:peptidoglycan hydrolase-like protein with peptidoglycan-binding domain
MARSVARHDARSTGVASLTRLVAIVAAIAIVAGACGDDEQLDPVAAAQARVSSAQADVEEAQTAYDEQSEAFCASSEEFITAVDRYGKLLTDNAVTVGDVKTAGADLVKPREEVEEDAEKATAAHETLTAAQADLAEAEDALEAAKSGTSTSAPTGTTTTVPLVPPATVDRAKQAEADLVRVADSISDQTQVVKAVVEMHSAAYAVEAAWLRIFADAGCLTDEQLAQASGYVGEYTVAVQSSLEALGYYSDEIDGVYGPNTVAAVKKFQTDANLPVTGYVDQPTATALGSALLAKGGDVAQLSIAFTAAVQSTLKLAGFWSGPIDGRWTDELTGALKAFQSSLGVEPTGVVDSATLSAVHTKIAEAKDSDSTTTTATSAATTTSAPASTTTTSG